MTMQPGPNINLEGKSMRILHMPGDNGCCVEFLWEGQVDELEAAVEQAKADVAGWEELLGGPNGDMLRDKFPELPIFKQLLPECHVGFDMAEVGEILISEADGSFKDANVEFESNDPISKSCTAVMHDGEWHVRVTSEVLDEYGDGTYTHENCFVPLDEFCRALREFAAAIAEDEPGLRPV